MKRWSLFLIACLCLLFLFGSCTSTRTETITEYVPVEIDLKDVVEPVFQLRPDNSKLDIHLAVQTTVDIVHNSVQYQKAWQNWQIYAEALEQVIEDIDEVYGHKEENQVLYRPLMPPFSYCLSGVMPRQAPILW